MDGWVKRDRIPVTPILLTAQITSAVAGMDWIGLGWIGPDVDGDYDERPNYDTYPPATVADNPGRSLR